MSSVQEANNNIALLDNLIVEYGLLGVSDGIKKIAEGDGSEKKSENGSSKGDGVFTEDEISDYIVNNYVNEGGEPIDLAFAQEIALLIVSDTPAGEAAFRDDLAEIMEVDTSSGDFLAGGQAAVAALQSEG